MIRCKINEENNEYNNNRQWQCVIGW
jgi:hypothetical protein